MKPAPKPATPPKKPSYTPAQAMLNRSKAWRPPKR